MTNKYYPNIFGDPLLFTTEKEAIKLLKYEKIINSLPDIELYVPVALNEEEYIKLNKITSKRSIVYDGCI